jgi:hypothetical protein
LGAIAKSQSSHCARQEFPSYSTRPCFPAGISVKVSATIASWILVIRRGGGNKRRDSKTKAVESTNHRKTCTASWGKINDTRATTKALIPIIKATKAVGENSSIKQRTAPASSQIKVKLIGIAAFYSLLRARSALLGLIERLKWTDYAKIERLSE